MIDTEIIENLSAKELEQLRALTDPLRLKLHSNFHEAKTVSEVAAILGVGRTSLYHHLQVLLKTGLIEEVETRKVRQVKELNEDGGDTEYSVIVTHFEMP